MSAFHSSCINLRKNRYGRVGACKTKEDRPRRFQGFLENFGKGAVSGFVFKMLYLLGFWCPSLGEAGGRPGPMFCRNLDAINGLGRPFASYALWRFQIGSRRLVSGKRSTPLS